MAEVIAFVSGKGGMGKTALCAWLATALAEAGQKVLCIDCHDVWGDLDRQLNLEPDAYLTYGEIARGQYPVDQAAVHQILPSLRFLAAPANPEAVSAAEFGALLRQARQKFDYILLDNPHQAFSADRYILVTTQNPAAVRGACRMADRLEVAGKTNVRLLVNAVDQQKGYMDIDDIIDRTGLQLLGIVPDSQCILAPRTKRVAAAADRIAQRILGNHTAIPRRL